MHQLHDHVYLHQDIDPDAYGSSDGVATVGEGVSILGYGKACCIMSLGAHATGGTAVMAVQYSTNDSAASSDYATISTDYVESTATVDSDGEDEPYIIDVDLKAAGIERGKIRLLITSAVAAVDHAGYILLYGGTRTKPVSQINTVIES